MDKKAASADAAFEAAALRVEELRREKGIGLDASYFASEIRKLKSSDGDWRRELEKEKK